MSLYFVKIISTKLKYIKGHFLQKYSSVPKKPKFWGETPAKMEVSIILSGVHQAIVKK